MLEQVGDILQAGLTIHSESCRRLSGKRKGVRTSLQIFYTLGTFRAQYICPGQKLVCNTFPQSFSMISLYIILFSFLIFPLVFHTVEFSVITICYITTNLIIIWSLIIVQCKITLLYINFICSFCRIERRKFC